MLDEKALEFDKIAKVIVTEVNILAVLGMRDLSGDIGCDVVLDLKWWCELQSLQNILKYELEP